VTEVIAILGVRASRMLRIAITEEWGGGRMVEDWSTPFSSCPLCTTFTFPCL